MLKLFSHNIIKPETTPPLRCGIVVTLASDLAGLQSPDGSLVPREKLGPGIIQQLDEGERLRVHWLGADFDSWLDPQDLRSPGAHAHLVTIKRRNKLGQSRLVRYRLALGSGFLNNWTVEFLPGSYVRAMRADGAVWTFGVNRLFRKIEVWWPQPPDDDDAEALAAADLAVH